VHWTQDAGRTTLYHHDHKYNHDAPFLNISSSNNNNNNNATATTSTSTISTTKERLWQRLQQLLDDGAKLLNDTTTTTTTTEQQQQQQQQVAEQAEATTTTTNTAETSIHKSTHPPKQVQVLGTTSESQQQQQQPPPSPKKKKKHAPPQTTKQTNDIDNDANNDNKDHDDKPKIRPMNIVLLYADDWSYKTLGKVNPFVQTPNLDQLADKGLLFTHNCVTTSVCWMSRATLLTGQYVSTHGILKPPQGSFFETWNQTLWQQLADAGYYNGFFGKWHNSMVRPDLIDTAMHDHDFYFGRHWETPTKHVTVKNYEHGMQFLKRKQWGERPFFLTISFFATHAMDTSKEQYYPQPESMSLYANDNDTVPMPQQYNTGNGNTNTNTTNAESSWQRMPYFFGERNEGRRRFQRRYQTNDLYQTMMKNMYRMATEVDTACGKIIDELERQNLLPHTMVIFTTDNGNYHSEHGLADKWFPHDESIRVPLIVWDPRMPASQAGTTNDEFTLNVDLAPTILSVSFVVCMFVGCSCSFVCSL
jgi:arylsulfatase